MFRKMRRFAQLLSDERCRDILRAEKRGVLSLQGDDGYPYGVPVDFLYCEADGRLYFHGAREGHKADAVKRCGKASFCVIGEGRPMPEGWALEFESVIVFGRISLVDDAEKTRDICAALLRKFTDDEAYIENELENALPRVQCFALTPEHITGKRVKES